ncbi:MAG: DoxX family protein [Acidobacteria bacterium]|nr:DoxX family protein [Acidobacteriota bacterium]
MVILGRYSEYVYAIFRIVFGFLIFIHGTQKWFNFPPAKEGASHPTIIMVAGVIELICGLLIIIGLFASLAAFIESGTMAVAYFMIHQPGGALPISNGGELAVAYCFACLYIAARGSGILSVDGLMRGSRATAAT